jgi:hypothetical protein
MNDKLVERMLDDVRRMLDASRRDSASRMLLDGVDDDDIEAFLAAFDLQALRVLTDARAQIEAMLAREREQIDGVRLLDATTLPVASGQKLPSV